MILTKITFEYDDGTMKVLEGNDVLKWDNYVEQVCISAAIHGVRLPFDKLKWREGKKIENEQTQKDSHKEGSNEEDKET